MFRLVDNFESYWCWKSDYHFFGGQYVPSNAKNKQTNKQKQIGSSKVVPIWHISKHSRSTWNYKL